MWPLAWRLFVSNNLIRILPVFDGIFKKGGARKKKHQMAIRTRRYLAGVGKVEED